MNLKSKIEIAQDLKLYVKDFYFDLAFSKSYIGFYDDEKNPVHNCDNKLYCDRLAITNVENSSILFKRGNYNSSDKSLKNLDWRSNSYGNYKIGGAFSFIKIEDSGFRTFKNSDNKASVLLKFDNLSERKATSLNIDKMKVEIIDDDVKEIEISAPSILLNNTTIKASDLTRVKERVIKDSYGITASDVVLDINGTFDSYSQAGIYAKSVKNNNNSNTIYIKGESNSQVKGGSLNLEGFVALNRSKIDCGGPLVINNSKLIGATLIDSSRSEVLIEESSIREAKIEELSFYDDNETKKPDTDFYIPYLKQKLIRYVSMEYIDLIGATLKYDSKPKNSDNYLLTIEGNIINDSEKIEDSIFNISSENPIKIAFKGLDKKEESPLIKNCSFLNGNDITIYGPVDFSNTVFNNSEVVIKDINSIKKL